MKKWIEERSEVSKFRKHEASWLAAAIDGEGSIGIYDYGKEGRRASITISNTNKEFIDRVKDIIGCGSSIFRANIHLTHKGRKPIYMYALKGSNRCYKVLKQLAPFLIIKKVKAEVIIKELESRPFGRWANATKEGRLIASELAKKRWSDPSMRAKIIAGIKSYHEEKKHLETNQEVEYI